MQCFLVCTCCTCLDTKDKETKRRCRGCVLLFRTCIFSQDRWHLVPPSELARRQHFPFDVTNFVALSSKKSPNHPNPPGFGKSCAPSLIILDTIQECQAKIAAPTLSFSELQADHWRAAESLLQSASDALRWQTRQAMCGQKNERFVMPHSFANIVDSKPFLNVFRPGRNVRLVIICS